MIAALSNKKIVKMGDQYVVCIPKQLIDANVLNPNKEYRWEIKEVKQK